MQDPKVGSVSLDFFPAVPSLVAHSRYSSFLFIHDDSEATRG